MTASTATIDSAALTRSRRPASGLRNSASSTGPKTSSRTMAGTEAEGPCVFELPEATLVLPPGWLASVDEAGTVRAEDRG